MVHIPQIECKLGNDFDNNVCLNVFTLPNRENLTKILI